MEPANTGMQLIASPQCWQQESFYFVATLKVQPWMLFCYVCAISFIQVSLRLEGIQKVVSLGFFLFVVVPNSRPHINSQQTRWEALWEPQSSGPEPGLCCCWSLRGAWLCSLQTLSAQWAQIRFSQLRASELILWLLVFLTFLSPPSLSSGPPSLQGEECSGGTRKPRKSVLSLEIHSSSGFCKAQRGEKPFYYDVETTHRPTQNNGWNLATSDKLI